MPQSDLMKGRSARADAMGRKFSGEPRLKAVADLFYVAWVDQELFHHRKVRS